MDSGIKKAKLKKATKSWQGYLKDKILIVGELFNGYNLIGILGEKDFSGLCKYAYENDKAVFDELGYETLNAWIEECELGNDGFGFSKDGIEILEEWKWIK